MNTTLDTINTTLATLNATLEHTSYSATAHTSKEGVVVVENSMIDLDDEAAAVAQEESDRAMTAALEAAGFTMLDAGPCGGESAYWSTWRTSTVDTTAHRDIVDGTTVTTAYTDIAPVYGESRAYAALDADEREWWDTTLTRMHAVAVAAARLPAKARDRVIHAGSDGDLEAAISAQERALAEETERLAAVSYEIVSATPNGHVGDRILFSTRERAEDALTRLAAAFGCDESDLRIVERDEAPDAGF